MALPIKAMAIINTIIIANNILRGVGNALKLKSWLVVVIFILEKVQLPRAVLLQPIVTNTILAILSAFLIDLYIPEIEHYIQ